MSVNGDQMKLVSTEYLAVLNSASKMLYVYNQDGGFEKVSEKSMPDLGDKKVVLSHDRAKFVTVYSYIQRINYGDVLIAELG
jgi:hypothetical protein